jgi:exopolysaccharide biosynthesis polyprenyl glycosylphosphotransferase
MHIRDHRLYHLIQLALDVLAVISAWQCTILLRIVLNHVAIVQVTSAETHLWAPRLASILPLWILLYFRFELYRSPDGAMHWSTATRVLESSVLLTIVTVVVTFFLRTFGAELSRLFVLVLFPVSYLLLALGRCLGLASVAAVQKHWVPPQRLAVLGDTSSAARLLRRMGPGQITQSLRGLIVPEGCTTEGFGERLPVLGTTRQLAELINREQLDRVIVLNGSIENGEFERCKTVFNRMRVPMTCAVALDHEPSRVDFFTEFGVPFVELAPLKFTRTQELLKRSFDLALAWPALVVLAPLMLVIAALVKLTSEGPVLYKAPRVGRGGRHFTFLKFRSMYVDRDVSELLHANEKSGHIFKIRNDPRVTPIGKILRKYSLDELPQLINILRGDMSLVGPRPLPARDLDPDGMSRQFAAWSEGRARVHPGLTGLWQVSGRGDLTFEDMIRLDLEYIRRWSLLLDVNIVLVTPMRVIKGAGAY